MNSIKLNTVKKSGDANLVPGVAYGPDLKENLHFAADYNELFKVITEAGANKIVNISVDSHDHEVLFKDVQYNPVTNDIIHFDVYAIKRGQKMKANIPVIMVGESPAVLKGAVLQQFIDEIEVECIPSKLPESFEIDASGLEEIGDSVSIDDIPKDEDVELLVEDNATIAKIEEVKEMKVEDDGPVDGPSEEGEEGEEATGGEQSEAGETSEAADGDKASEEASDKKE